MVRHLLLFFILSSNVFADTIQKYKNTAIDSPNFLELAFDAAKEYINKDDYQKAINIAYFYRHNFMDQEKKYEVYFQESFYQLEVFALSKTCNFNAAKLVLDEYKKIIKILNKDKTKLQETEKVLKANEIILTSTKNKKDFTNKLDFEKVTTIPLKGKVSSIAHPKHLYIKLNNQCNSK